MEQEEKHSATRQPIAWLPLWALVVAWAAVSATANMFITRGEGRGMFMGLLCLETLLLAAGFDSATGRIPNPITYTAILLGLGLNAVSFWLARATPGLVVHWLGAAGPTQSLLGLLLFGGIGLVCRAVAGMGGGDMKLLAAVGALLGTARAADAMGCALAAAVVYALINLVTGGGLNAAARNLSTKALSALYPQVVLPVGSHRSRTSPMAIPMFLGLLLSALPPIAAGITWLRGAG